MSIDDGVEVEECTEAEWRALVETACQRRMGYNLDEFIARWNAGEIGWDNPIQASHVAMLWPWDLA